MGIDRTPMLVILRRAALAGCLAAACVLAPGSALADEGPRTAPAAAPGLVPAARMAVVSPPGESAIDPALASGAGRVVAAWSARGAEGSRVRVAAFDGEAWWPSFELDPIDGAADGEPSPAMDPEGLAAVAFARVSSAGSQVLLWREGEGVDIVAASADRVESPSLAFAADGRPIVAWTESAGGEFRVFSAEYTGGGWRHRQLSDPASAYDIHPAAIGGSEPRIAWYSLGRDGFEPRSARLGAARGDRGSLVEEAALGSPANRLPILFAGPGGAVNSVWIEPLPGGEAVLAHLPSDGGAIVAAPRSQPGANQLQPSGAVLAEGAAGLAWIEEHRGRARAMAVAGGEWIRLDGIAAPSQPRIAAAPKGGAVVVVASDPAAGGDGLLRAYALAPAE